MVRSLIACKAILVFVLCFTLSLPALAAPKGVPEMLTAAKDRGELIYRTVLETALMAYPNDRTAILLAAEQVAPEFLLEAEVYHLLEIRDAEAAEEARQRARGIFYYLDPTLWNSRADLGASFTTGDTQERSIALALHFDRQFDGGWSHRIDINTDFARRRDVTTRERFVFDYGVRYDLLDWYYGVSTTRVEFDRFTGYDYRISEVLGAGFRILDNGGAHKLFAEIGAGARINKLAADPMDGSDLTLSEFIARIAINYDWAISEDLTLSNRASGLLGSNSITLENDLVLSARINGSLSARFSFGTFFESDPPPGTSQVDTVSRVSLSYTF